MKKGIMAVVLLTACIQLALAAGAGEAAAAWLNDAITSGKLISTALRYEYDLPKETPSPSPAPAYSPVPVLAERPTVPGTPVPSPTPETVRTADYSTLELDNDSSYAIDPAALMDGGLALTLPRQGPQILIMHTHGTESYTMEEGWEYLESDYARTTDSGYNMIKVGDVLAQAFEEHGLKVLHDRTLHDYPSYTGSYTRSAETVQTYLNEYPDLSIVIDLHRDAITSGDTVYKTQADIPDADSSQIMLLVGTGENGLSHPDWQENLKLALLMQERASSRYPTLMRPLNICKERYNQQLSKGSLIIEVGSNGNTLAEAITAAELFADAVAPALLELIEQ